MVSQINVEIGIFLSIDLFFLKVCPAIDYPDSLPVVNDNLGLYFRGRICYFDEDQ